jgi:hypothetical protein
MWVGFFCITTSTSEYFGTYLKIHQNALVVSFTVPEMAFMLPT